MKVLVTGGSGTIGSYVLRELLHARHEVTCFARKTAPLVEGAEFLAGDIMDRTLKRFPIERLDDELDWSPRFRVAFQRDMSRSVPYDARYFEKYCRYEDTPIARRINAFRTGITGRLPRRSALQQRS